MNQAPHPLIAEYLKPVPTPAGMTSREVVRRAIEFDMPPRIPYSFLFPLQSDFFETGRLRVSPDYPTMAGRFNIGKPGRRVGDVYYDDWGVGYRVTGQTWDHAFDHPLKDLRKLADYEFPDAAAPEPYDRIATHVHQAHQAGKYVVGADHILMFERMRALMGFEDLMVAPYEQPDGLESLLDRLANLVIAAIQQWGRIGGVDAFMTWEDFGLQMTLQMRVETFREFYKPRYARIVQAAHDQGMHYIWHNCGYVLDMIPDLIEIGVDVLQLDQPRPMGHSRLAAVGNGRICFWNTVDIQWSTEGDGVTPEELRAEVAQMVTAFQGLNGGFMARQYPAPQDIGLSNETNMVIYEAFLDNGCGLLPE